MSKRMEATERNGSNSHRALERRRPLYIKRLNFIGLLLWLSLNHFFCARSQASGDEPKDGNVARSLKGFPVAPHKTTLQRLIVGEASPEVAGAVAQPHSYVSVPWPESAFWLIFFLVLTAISFLEFPTTHSRPCVKDCRAWGIRSGAENDPRVPKIGPSAWIPPMRGPTP